MTRATDPDDERTFRLAELVRAHEREVHPLGLADVLGDGALLGRIPLLEAMRRVVLGFGYRFAPRSELPGVNELFPVMELAAILEHRAIPYQRTAAVAKAVLARTPELRLRDEHFRDICAGSFTHHEGGHAIVWELALAAEGPLRGARLVEVLLASEAFAMAFEQLVALRPEARAHRLTPLFLALGSYANPLDRRKHASAGVRAPSEALDALVVAEARAVLRLLASAYMVALLRPSARIGQPALAAFFAEYAGLTGAHAGDAEHLFDLGLFVAGDFREEIQRGFYAYLGLDDELSRLRARPLERSFEDGAAFHTFIPHAIELVLQPCAGAVAPRRWAPVDPSRAILDVHS